MAKHGTGQVFHVTEDESGCTLAAYLRTKIKGTSWAVAERWIRNRRITIHGNICLDAARRLNKGEVVKFLDVPALHRRPARHKNCPSRRSRCRC